MRAEVVIILAFCITHLVAKLEDCYDNGITWSSQDQIVVIPQVTSVNLCILHCIKNENCKGYTWHGQLLDNRISNVCVLFEKTLFDGSYECSNCVSGQLDEISEFCICQKQSRSECVITDSNFIQGVAANSELECFVHCSYTDRCFFYTWYR